MKNYLRIKLFYLEKYYLRIKLFYLEKFLRTSY